MYTNVYIWKNLNTTLKNSSDQFGSRVQFKRYELDTTCMSCLAWCFQHGPSGCKYL